MSHHMSSVKAKTGMTGKQLRKVKKVLRHAYRYEPRVTKPSLLAQKIQAKLKTYPARRRKTRSK